MPEEDLEPAAGGHPRARRAAEQEDPGRDPLGHRARVRSSLESASPLAPAVGARVDAVAPRHERPLQPVESRPQLARAVVLLDQEPADLIHIRERSVRADRRAGAPGAGAGA